MMGFPKGWVDGLSRTARLKALGNAVVPQQAQMALVELLARDWGSPPDQHIGKPIYATGVSHPAVYSSALLPIFVKILREHFEDGPVRVLDPFAGVGRIHELATMDSRFETVGVEIEKEWADLHPRTIKGNTLTVRRRFDDESFDAIVVSPTWGNRMADSHNPKDASLRRSYKFDIGRDLHSDNSGQLQWGSHNTKYQRFHVRAWKQVLHLLKQDGLFLLNCKDHIRAGKRQPVTRWHIDTLKALGCVVLEEITVATPGMRFGANRDKRLEEYVVVLQKA
jgi:hypothetical protein